MGATVERFEFVEKNLEIHIETHLYTRVVIGVIIISIYFIFGSTYLMLGNRKPKSEKYLKFIRIPVPGGIVI